MYSAAKLPPQSAATGTIRNDDHPTISTKEELIQRLRHRRKLLVHAELTGATSPVSVKVAGGDTLSIGFTKDGDSYQNVTLTGPADFVFEGTLTLPV